MKLLPFLILMGGIVLSGTCLEVGVFWLISIGHPNLAKAFILTMAPILAYITVKLMMWSINDE